MKPLLLGALVLHFSFNQARADSFCESVMAAIRSGGNNFTSIQRDPIQDYGFKSGLTLAGMDECDIQIAQQDEKNPPVLYCQRQRADSFDGFETDLTGCLKGWTKTSGTYPAPTTSPKNKAGAPLRWMQFVDKTSVVGLRSWQRSDDVFVISISKTWRGSQI
jgi:hypothetical protein